MKRSKKSTASSIAEPQPGTREYRALQLRDAALSSISARLSRELGPGFSVETGSVYRFVGVVDVTLETPVQDLDVLQTSAARRYGFQSSPVLRPAQVRLWWSAADESAASAAEVALSPVLPPVWDFLMELGCRPASKRFPPRTIHGEDAELWPPDSGPSAWGYRLGPGLGHALPVARLAFELPPSAREPLVLPWSSLVRDILAYMSRRGIRRTNTAALIGLLPKASRRHAVGVMFGADSELVGWLWDRVDRSHIELTSDPAPWASWR